MKKYLKYIIAALAVLSIAACEKIGPVSDEPQDGGPYVKLTVNAPSAQLVTKATKDGVDKDNENLLSSIDCFFYPKGRTSFNAVVKSHIEPDAKGNYNWYVSLTPELLATLFPGVEKQCDVYVVANWGTDLSALSDTRLASLQALTTTSDFLGSDIGLSPQPKFVMTGVSVAQLQSTQRTIAATGSISLKRLASRITVGISTTTQYIEQIKNDDGTDAEDEFGNKIKRTWYSEPGSLGIVLYNCGNVAALSGNPEAVPSYPDYHFSYGSFSGSSFVSARVMKDSGAKDSGLADPSSYSNQYVCDRFYSYPVSWKTNSDDEAYFLVRMYWKYTDELGSHSIPYFYKVIVPFNSFDSNCWYHFNIRLSVLGSLSALRPTVVVDEGLAYYVADWKQSIETSSGGGSGEDYNVDAEIRDARYIVVESNSYNMPNQTTISIPFESSHDCIILGEGVSTSGVGDNNWSSSTRPKYTKYDFVNKKYIVENSVDEIITSASDYRFGIKIVNDMTSHVRRVVITHNLKNDTSVTGYDYTKYAVTFRIAHADNTAYYETVTVTQIPALYIDGQENSMPSNDGGVIVDSGLGGVHGLTATGNQNSEMYIISTSVLPFDSAFILGDPRKKTEDNLYITSSHAPIDGSANRQLTYYYPTIEDGTADNVIAPVMRIASSYGVTNSLTYNNAKKRCATYQEDGYPAGRWRLPTKAEVQYINKLSHDGKIKALFTNNQDYWCANGYVNNGVIHGNPGDDEDRPVRCVYDEWYWAESAYPRIPESSRNVHTWGDAAR